MIRGHRYTARLVLPLLGFGLQAQPSPIVRTCEAVLQTGLSPGALEIAQLAGVRSDLEKMMASRGLPTTLDDVGRRQIVLEGLLGLALNVNDVTAEIMIEQSELDVARGSLQAVQDKRVNLNDTINILLGVGVGVVAPSLSLRSSTTTAGDGVALVSGAAATALGVVSLRQRPGGRQMVGPAPNMLAQILGRKPALRSVYPDDVWTYLESAPPGSTVTRRAALLEDWTAQGFIHLRDSPEARRRIDMLTSSSTAQDVRLNRKELFDRYCLLTGVTKAIAAIRHYLAEVMQAFRCTGVPPTK